MAQIMRQIFTAGKEIPPEVIARIEEAAKHPGAYECDEDCPELTDEQLAQFYPANFATMEERHKAMFAGRTPSVAFAVAEPTTN